MMSATSSLTTSLLRLVPLALRRSGPLSATCELPRIARECRLHIDEGWLRQYRRLVGAAEEGVLPPCAPQVLASGLHLAILGDKRYPFPVLGMVHTKNLIEERAPLPEDATLLLEAALEAVRHTERGVEIDIVTTCHVDGEHFDGPPPWRSVLTALVRRRGTSEGKNVRASREEHPQGASPSASSSVVQVKSDLGRRYARLAGDANPIHLTRWSAQAFGFPRAIAHGMWTLQRALSEAEEYLPARPRAIEARFVRPVLLPGAIVIHQNKPEESEHSLTVMPTRNGPPHLVIRSRALPTA